LAKPSDATASPPDPANVKRKAQPPLQSRADAYLMGDYAISYHTEALIPLPPFTPVAACRLHRLTPRDAMRSSIHTPLVSLLSLPCDFISSLNGGIFAKNQEEAEQALRSVSADKLVKDALRSLESSYTWSKGTEEFITLRFNAPNRPTVTHDAANLHHLGIHLDSWDGGTPVARLNARKRFCVNVGTQSRYFLFSTVDCARIDADLNLQGYDADWQSVTTTATDLARRVLLEDGSGIFRLKVPPGWAYLAPTEFLPHDGSNQGSMAVDFSFQILADFRPLKRLYEQSEFVLIAS
jgi:hypothetical protein